MSSAMLPIGDILIVYLPPSGMTMREWEKVQNWPDLAMIALNPEIWEQAIIEAEFEYQQQWESIDIDLRI